jgi:hypothetical protein
MSKIYVVDSCLDCPHFFRVPDRLLCLKYRFTINDETVIPEQCQLKDYNREAE